MPKTPKTLNQPQKSKQQIQTNPTQNLKSQNKIQIAIQKPNQDADARLAKNRKPLYTLKGYFSKSYKPYQLYAIDTRHPHQHPVS